MCWQILRTSSPEIESATNDTDLDARHNDGALRHALFRDRDGNPDVLDPADGGLEQDAEKKKALAVPYSVIHGVIVSVIESVWKP